MVRGKGRRYQERENYSLQRDLRDYHEISRDINSNKVIYAHTSNLYPRWVTPPWTNRDNMLRPIQLGLNQFPVLAFDAVKIVQEF